VNATLEAGVVMATGIRGHFERTGARVGLKAAGGIRTADDALAWVALVRRELGEEWLTPRLFRIGASALLGALEDELSRAVS
jgi:deoxyribose-phosphate aldolase